MDGSGTGLWASIRLPPADRPGGAVVRRLRTRLMAGILTANTIGALVVFVLAAFIVPLPGIRHVASQLELNLVVAAAYVLAALAVGTLLGFRRMAGPVQWLSEATPPSPTDQEEVLRAPFRLATETGGLWAIAVVVFTLVNLGASSQLAVTVGAVVAFGGTVTCSVAYLFAERGLREPAGLALLSAGRPRQVQSVAARQVLTWALSTGVPILGVVAVGVASLAGAPHLDEHLARTMVALGGTALAVGLLATVVAARASADPITSVRRAVEEIGGGNLDVEVPVYDGTEIGLLQAGFNRMAAGLRERAELADLFGRHVGVDVARRALEGGIELGGESRQVAVLFVDLVGSTTLAVERPPVEVVRLLNRFFGVVVEEVEDHGGFVNKFEGDAALAVFGAPEVLADHAGCALRTARVLGRRLRDEVGADFGIGVASGEAVAGNIGSVHRLEYTVIGDPVNEAARLTDLAKSLPGRVAASGTVVGEAGDESRAWEEAGEVVLRGRSAPTAIHVPVAGAEVGDPAPPHEWRAGSH